MNKIKGKKLELKKNEEEIPHYKDGSILTLEIEDNDCYYKRFEKCGYHKRSDLLEPYFYVNHDSIFIEITWLTNGFTHILELWDRNECLFIFYANSSIEAMELALKLLDFADKLVNIEYKLMMMHKQNDDEIEKNRD